jgi:hypothetical protein
MSRKKGIITFHREPNYGAFLQAYAQSQLLNAEIVDINSSKQSSNTKKVIFEKAIKENMNLSKDSFIMKGERDFVEFLNSQDYSSLIVGADEIWKTGNLNPDSVYFLGGDIKAKKISCAASANRLRYKELTEDSLKIIQGHLSSFYMLGVRDQHTLDFLSYIGLRGVKVPDPTIAYDFSKEKEFYRLNSKTKKLGLSFLASKNPDFYKKIVSLFNKYEKIGLRVLNPLSDKDLLKINPFQWISIISQLDFLITDSFHHAIFAIKNNIPVLCYDGETNIEYTSKLYDLLSDLDLLFCYSNGEEFEKQVIDILSIWNNKENQRKLKEMEIKYYTFIRGII